MYLVNGRRLAPLRRVDLFDLARGIVAVQRRKALAARGYTAGVVYVRLSAPGFEVLVLGTDWDKIVPYLQDQTFDPAIVAEQTHGFIDAHASLDFSVIEKNDLAFFTRVYGQLQVLFPEDYPTSKL